MSRLVCCATSIAVVAAVAGPLAAFGVREGQTQWLPQDADGDGKTDTWAVDLDGDGNTDEVWHDWDEDGTVDEVVLLPSHPTHSARGVPGKTKVTPIPLPGGGDAAGIDWEGDGKYDEYWWDTDGDGVIEDADIKHTESKVIDNTKSTRFRGVFVGVKNGLDYPEKDVDDLTGALQAHPESWDAADMNSLKGDAATPAAIQGAIDAAKAQSKPGDEFIFYFSGHGGGYHKDKGYKGGIIDADGDETAIVIKEKDFRADGSKLTTPAAGWYNCTFWDTDGDGKSDRAVTKDANGLVEVRAINPGPPRTVGASLGKDTNGDGIVDAADGGVDINNDGDKDDSFAVDDTIKVAGNKPVTDDQLTSWLSGFPESCTIVVILDSCFSGSFVPDLKRVKDKDGKPLRPGHLEAITASAADDFAYEEPISNGVLTQGILNALKPVDSGAGTGHITTVADKASGAPDDITTTHELFSFASPQAVMFHIGDEDGDGLLDEDSFTHEYESFEVEVGGEVPDIVSGIIHGVDDPDSDGPDNIDLDPPVVSFFDEHFGPPMELRDMPRFIQTFGGDTSLSLTGMQPGFGAYCEAPFMPGTSPAIQVEVERLPWASVPEPPPGMSYASECYDVNVWFMSVMPGLDDEDHSMAMLDRLPIAGGWSPDSRAKIGLGQWVPPAVADVRPFWYNPGAGEWIEIPDYSYDPITDRVVDYPWLHTSLFALFYIGPPPLDMLAPLAPLRLTAHREGLDAQLVWSNPTDPDFDVTRIYRSASGYATDPTGGSGQTLVYEGDGWHVLDDGVDPGALYYYTAFSSDVPVAGAIPNWSDAATVMLDMGSVETPIQGVNRFKTAIAASAAAFPNGLAFEDSEGHLSAVVATGRNWPDALGASALAGAVHGPILLTEPGALPAEVAAELDRLGADRVFIVGGDSAVSPAVEAAILARPDVETVERLEGTDRYLTAEAIARRTVGLLGDRYDGTLFVATGTNFPDALAASPLAYRKGWPLLLSTASGLTLSTKSVIDEIGATDAIVLGGERAVSPGVVTYLGDELDSANRLFGEDRYRTAIAVAAFGTEEAGLRWEGMGLATGQNYPDALSGGVLVGQRSSVMLLTPSASLNADAAAAITAHRDEIAEVIYFGGEVALSAGVRAAVAALLY